MMTTIPTTKLYYTKLPPVDQRNAIDVTGKPKPYHSLAGERLLNYGCFQQYGITVTEEMKAKTKFGKPYLKNYPSVHYNISHSGDYVAVALSPCEIGIDIQVHRQKCLEKLAKRTLSQWEYRLWEVSPAQERDFYQYWVMKESYLKWTGEGITKDLRTLDMRGWHCFFELDGNRNYSAALWAGHEVQLVLERV